MSGRTRKTVEDSSQTDHLNIMSIKKKLRINSAIVTKADKGNTLVIIDNNSYIGKVERFIQENDIATLDKDPTNDFAKEINKTLNSCNTFFKNETSRRFLKPMNPHVPRLNGQPKIHKQDIPIRPVVDYTSALGSRRFSKSL